MDAKEEMTKFRYNLTRFQNSMAEYETILSWANQLRAKKRTEEQNGYNVSNKWDTFIAEKETQSTQKLNEAEEAYLAMKDILCGDKCQKPKTKTKKKA